jgi:hypothetical protein
MEWLKDLDRRVETADRGPMSKGLVEIALNLLVRFSL